MEYALSIAHTHHIKYYDVIEAILQLIGFQVSDSNAKFLSTEVPSNPKQHFNSPDLEMCLFFGYSFDPVIKFAWFLVVCELNKIFNMCLFLVSMKVIILPFSENYLLIR